MRKIHLERLRTHAQFLGRLDEVAGIAASRGWSTRRTGTSISILHANGNAEDLDGERRGTNLEDVFVLLTGEEIS